MEIKIFNLKFERFVESLEKPIIAKVLRTIDLLEKFGNKLGMPHCKKISAGLFELRIRGKKEIRIIYTFRNYEAVILHAFVKKTQKTPRREIVLAEKKLTEIDYT